ncbi:CarboxypepD_reg-like domain-containing protein [Lutibacter oricola]|uniref:CarboxypepD_reg-like domain-containing protein n=1 Tax=Lutibacter oricola TaxID=762486 RepID=A0A1H2RIK6_9FLAO|nr:TonB-dependent receptor [Lutibacter oricola]SDW19296.1 CarboxypepD_reg-like domain-containing protein [Lutibacter oricola]
MKKLILLGFLCFSYIPYLRAQTTYSIRGEIQEVTTENPLSQVQISILNTNYFTETDIGGIFVLEKLQKGDYKLQIRLTGYLVQTLPISLEKSIDLGTIYLEPIIDNFQDASIISLTDDDLTEDNSSNSEYISGLFQSSKDAYLKAAAFNFSQAWFKVRGYDSRYGQITLNGVEMNKFYDGRPQWSNWGGLNDALRNQDFSNGIAPSEVSFGNMLGTTNFKTRASLNREGGKVSYALTNKSYTGRAMATYSTGLNDKNWALTVSGSRRYAEEGYMDGTPYNSWSGFIAAEKKFNENHSINLTAIGAFNRKGKSSPSTQEVYDLKGYTYNSYWGDQVGDIRNSRMKEIFEPIVMLTHYYTSEKSTLTSSISYQTGHTTNGRLGYFNAPNPDPTYWKYLPSNYLRGNNYDLGQAYLADQDFRNNGQLNWNELYLTNAGKENASYYVYDDRVEDSQISFNSNFNTKINANVQINTGVSFKSLSSRNFAEMTDLLGATSFLDIDQYAIGDARDNDLNNPNKVVGVGDEFQYNYNIAASSVGAFAQVQVTSKKVDYFAGLNFKNSNFQRDGLYKNGTFANNSFGKGEKQSFSDFSAKGGFTYKFTGRHLFNVNGAYLSNAATIRTVFSNSRVNNEITPTITSEKVVTADANYIFRSPKIQARLTGYFTKISDAVETSFLFAEGLRGDQADFVSEILTGVEKKHIGAELSLEYQATPTVKVLGAGSFGQFTYNNNPNLYLQSESFVDEDSDFGTAYLQDYKLSGTPQRAYLLGIEYRDPTYYWFQVSGNYMSNNYLDISPLLRTENFYVDTDGIPFIDDETGVQVTQEQVDGLLQQEKFDDIFLMNIVAGKSWKINDYYLGVFAGINNVLGETYKTGGFEQARNANYPELKEDKNLENPIFGPKYWYNSGTSYYFNLYVRF